MHAYRYVRIFFLVYPLNNVTFVKYMEISKEALLTTNILKLMSNSLFMAINSVHYWTNVYGLGKKIVCF